jgi:uncharacterized membrane protein YcaP (DUF421 family)
VADALWASWSTIGWVAASTAAIYVTTVVTVRIAGRRTLTQLSGFDIIVTIALGSVVATTAVQASASYLQGAVAVVTLLALQTVAAALRQRFVAFRRLLDFSPEVVVRDGRIDLRAAPGGPQLTEDELRSRLRQKGVFDLDGVHLVIVEPTGELSVRPTEA